MRGERNPFSRSASIEPQRYICKHFPRRRFEIASLFVLMNIVDLSRIIHFDRDLSADGDVSEHAALRSEVKTLLPSRRRQRHLGCTIINRGKRTSDEARSLAGLSFRMGIHNHVAFVDPEGHFITDFWGRIAVAEGRCFGQRERSAGRRLDGIETGLLINHHTLDLFDGQLSHERSLRSLSDLSERPGGH